MSWENDLVTLGTDAGFTVGTDFFTTLHSTVPKIPGKGTIHITEVAAGPPERTHNSVAKPAYVHVGAQVRARGDTPLIAYVTARRFYDQVVGLRNVFVGATQQTATFYREINPLSEPREVAADAHDQSSYVFTIHAIKRYSVGD